MTAIVLAGGKGARLRSLTQSLPKPLLPLGDITVLEVIVRQLVSAGASRIVLSLNHCWSLFDRFLQDARESGFPVESVIESEPLGTAGPIRLVPQLEDSHFLVVNGDVLTTLDFKKVFDIHVASAAAATICTTTVSTLIDYGVITTGANGRVQHYSEKPAVLHQVSMGINVLSHATLKFIPEGLPTNMPDLINSMNAAGLPIFNYQADCYWNDIGRVQDYDRALNDFLRKPGIFLAPSAGAK